LKDIKLRVEINGNKNQVLEALSLLTTFIALDKPLGDLTATSGKNLNKNVGFFIDLNKI